MLVSRSIQFRNIVKPLNVLCIRRFVESVYLYCENSLESDDNAICCNFLSAANYKLQYKRTTKTRETDRVKDSTKTLDLFRFK